MLCSYISSSISHDFFLKNNKDYLYYFIHKISCQTNSEIVEIALDRSSLSRFCLKLNNILWFCLLKNSTKLETNKTKKSFNKCFNIFIYIYIYIYIYILVILLTVSCIIIVFILVLHSTVRVLLFIHSFFFSVILFLYLFNIGFF